MRQFITIDNETGGIEKDKSLLTVYAGVFDVNFKFVDELYLYLKPPDDAYIVTAEALRINRINLIEHQTKAVPYKEGATKLYDFIKKHSEDGKNRLVPVGQNVTFDIDHIHDKLILKKNWDKFCSYRIRDTGILAGSMQDAGMIDEAVSGGLYTLLDYFGVPYVKEELHDARVDALKTLELYQKMIEFMRSVYNGSIQRVIKDQANE
jgi:DNA polymerase III epsilon subunit-like protein